MRYFLEIAYVGTAFHGWQRQPGNSSVQQTLEEALGLLLREPIAITGAGRTDTGVHARKQFAHLDTEAELITEKEFLHKLNSILPREIAIQQVYRPVSPSLHARYDALSRTYRYHLTFRKDPFSQGLALYYPYSLDVELMQAGAELLKQQHDFASFCKAGSEPGSTQCTLYEADWIPTADGLYFQVAANRFLRGMVRALVGTLFDLGRRKTTLEDLKAIIHARDRAKAAMSAQPQGLYLTDVAYPLESLRPIFTHRLL